MNIPKRRIVILAIALLVLATLFACNLVPSVTLVKPVVSIGSPPHNAQVALGEEVLVQISAVDAVGITRVELWVDGMLSTMAQPPLPQTSYTTVMRCTPSTIGAHTLVVKAINTSSIASDPAMVAINVVSVGEMGKTPSVPTPQVVTATPQQGTPFAGDWGGPDIGDGSWIALRLTQQGDRLQGVMEDTYSQFPSDAPIVAPGFGGSGSGTALSPTEGRVTFALQRSDGLKAQAEFRLVLSELNQSLRLTEVMWDGSPTQPPVEWGVLRRGATKPPTPPTALPTALPTASSLAPPPPTLCPGPPVIESFTANPGTITAGQSTTLNWGAVTNATSAVIDQGIGGVGTPGSRSVNPATTTTYTLTATGCGGTTTRLVTVTVTGSPTPPPLTFTFSPKSGPAGSEVNLYLSAPQSVTVYYSGGLLPKKVSAGGKTLTVTIPADATGSGYFELQWDGQSVKASEPFTVAQPTRKADLAMTDVYTFPLGQSQGTVWFKFTNNGPDSLTNMTVGVECWGTENSYTPGVPKEGLRGDFNLTITLKPGQPWQDSTGWQIDIKKKWYEINCEVTGAGFTDPNAGNNQLAKPKIFQ